MRITRGHAPRHTVLVVDSDDDRRDMLATLLHHDGFRVLTAATAMKTQAILSRERCDALIVYHNPPENDGETLLLRLRHHPAMEWMPTVLISSEQHDADTSYADAVIEEPWQLQQLLAVLRKMMQRVAGAVA